jgi:2'-5' RNA ligase
MRCFIAIKPPLTIANEYYNHLMKYKSAFYGSIVKPEKMHITLFFFENLEKSEVLAVCETLKEFERYSSFKVNLSHYSCFYRKSNPVVCFVAAISEELFNLRESMAEKLKGTNYDDKEFKAHLTLLRIKRLNDKSKFEKFLTEKKQAFFYVNELHFIESRLTNRGPEYSDIYKLTLKG